ncbi:hypothetical protein PBI_NEBKISS_33 [Mycobacterium phage Nebkiss]|nr:hypothetical protein PBI_NEBKISS_33 [Mycobacterium phage Nebkiss]
MLAKIASIILPILIRAIGDYLKDNPDFVDSIVDRLGDKLGDRIADLLPDFSSLPEDVAEQVGGLLSGLPREIADVLHNVLGGLPVVGGAFRNILGQ